MSNRKITSYLKKITNLGNQANYIQANIEISNGNSGGPFLTLKMKL